MHAFRPVVSTIAAVCAYAALVAAVTFQIHLDEDSKKCPNAKKGMETLVQTSNVEFARGAHNELIANGQFVWTGENVNPGDELTFKVDCKYKDRGTYHSSPYLYVLKDFCAGWLDKERGWYNVTKQLTAEQRKVCPPAKGTIFQVKDVSILPQFTIPIGMKEGEYACEINGLANNRPIVCFVYKGDVKVISLVR